MLSAITPVILTCNEAPNIGRTLERLRWARDVVLVDSGSTDGTVDIASSFPNTRLFRREFDAHATQWTYAIRETGIRTPWVLALDADYVLSDAFVDELSALMPGDVVSGYEAAFVYAIDGKPLRGTLYPPVTVLFRAPKARYVQDGHTHRVVVDGMRARLKSPIVHDDRKPLARWFAAQRAYMRLEAYKLASSDFSALTWPDRIRRLRFVAPAAVMLYCLFWKGLILDGKAGVSYSLQRGYAELLLSLYLLRLDVAALLRLRIGRP